MTILRPWRTACRTSSSHTNSALFSVGAVGRPIGESAVTGAARPLGEGAAGGAYPRDARNSSIRRASDSAAIPAGLGASVTLGNEAISVSARFGAGDVSHASLFILSRCCGPMLSDVMFPPHPPHPSVIDGSNDVVRPIDPSVVGVLTTIRKAGFFRPN